jgi:hypothetical protein
MIHGKTPGEVGAIATQLRDILRESGFDTRQAIEMCAFLAGVTTAEALLKGPDPDATPKQAWQAAAPVMSPIFERAYAHAQAILPEVLAERARAKVSESSGQATRAHYAPLVERLNKVRGLILLLGLATLPQGCSGEFTFEPPDGPLCFDVDESVGERLPFVYESLHMASEDAWGVQLEGPGAFLVCPRRIYFGENEGGQCTGSTLSSGVCLDPAGADLLLPPEATECDPRGEFYLDNVLTRAVGIALEVPKGEGVMGDLVPCGRELPTPEQIRIARGGR